MRYNLLYAAISLVFFILSACQFAEITSYEHQESQVFYKSGDIDSPEIERFIFSGTLLVVDVNEATHEDSIVWLGVYSKQLNQTFKLDRAIIQGKQWKEENDVGARVLTEISEKHPALFKNSIKLFQLKTQLLHNAYLEGGELTIIVFFDVGNGMQQRAEFDLKRKVVKRTVFPT